MQRPIVCLSAALLAASSFGAIRAVTPVAWDGNPDCWQMKRHLEKMQCVTNGGSKVVFIGDSITHFWESDWHEGKPVWENYFKYAPYCALDLGTSADRTEHVLWRITKGGELDGYEAKCILLMIGTNNSGHFAFEQEPPIDTILGIREILKTIQVKQPSAKIVLTAIFPRGATPEDSYRQRNETVNREIAKFADGKRIFWVDFNEQFLTVDGTLPLAIFPDRLHPRRYGYEVWAAAVKPYIDYALSDGKLPPPPNRFAPFVRGGNFCVNDPIAVFPATRIEGLNDWRLARMLAKRNQIADSDGKFDLVLVGDSITHGWENKPSYTELTNRYSVLNLGYSADRTENLSWRLENGELCGYQAKCFMLMIGTNNSGHRMDNPSHIAQGVKRILGTIAAKQPDAKVILLPIFPRGSCAQNKERVNNENVNRIIKDYADGEKVIWLDFNAQLLDEKGDAIKYMADRLHPNDAGYREVWMASVLPTIEKIVGK